MRFYVRDQYDVLVPLQATTWPDAYKEAKLIFPYYMGKLKIICVRD